MSPPAFFKFFNPQGSSHRLNVPLSFTLYLNGMLPDQVFLRDKHGNLWPVRVLKTGHDLFFTDGWVKFIADNGVTLGDFLVFQYNGCSVFDFKLLGTTGCEKNSTGVKIEEERENNENEDNEEDDDEEEGENAPFSVSKRSPTRLSELPKRTRRPEEEEEEEHDDHDNESEEEVEDADDEDYEEEEDIKVKKIVRVARLESCSAHSKKVRKRTTRSRAAAWNSAADIFKSGLIPLPTNPYFIARLIPRKRKELYIPNNVIIDHKLEIPDEIIIRDINGNAFLSRAASWTDGRKVLTDGWRDFCRENKVKQKDRCLCEFLSCQELLIRVLHFQEGRWRLRP